MFTPAAPLSLHQALRIDALGGSSGYKLRSQVREVLLREAACQPDHAVLAARTFNHLLVAHGTRSARGFAQEAQARFGGDPYELALHFLVPCAGCYADMDMPQPARQMLEAVPVSMLADLPAAGRLEAAIKQAAQRALAESERRWRMSGAGNHDPGYLDFPEPVPVPVIPANKSAVKAYGLPISPLAPEDTWFGKLTPEQHTELESRMESALAVIQQQMGNDSIQPAPTPTPAPTSVKPLKPYFEGVTKASGSGKLWPDFYSLPQGEAWPSVTRYRSQGPLGLSRFWP